MPENKEDLKKGEFTGRYRKVVKNIKEQTDKQNVGAETFKDDAQGFEVDKKTVTATPKKFKRKIIKTEGFNGSTKIIGDDGKTVIYEGRNQSISTDKAIKETQSKETDVNNRREKNSNFFNVTSGSKKALTITDLNTLEKLGSFKRK